MSSPCGPDSDIADWLATIHLERYRDVFKQHGIHVARDALTLDGDHLQQLGITATGHRKRILNLAQQTRLRAQPRAGSPHPRAPPMGEDAMKAEPGAATDAFGMQQRGTMPSHASSLEKDPSPPLVKPVPKPRTESCSSHFGRGGFLFLCCLQRGRELSHGSASPSSCGQHVPAAPCFRLVLPRAGHVVCLELGLRSAPGRSEDEETRTRLIERIAQNDTEGYSTVEAPRAEGTPFSLPPHLYPDEVLDDLTISPYASYTSLSEPRPTMLSGWLDKLSPQGNYVFQRRYVRFDGKNLMYFSSEKESYPKGVIPLSVIEMVRASKDNKFQVVTSHRIFVFRAENEAQRNEWCSTLQKKVTDQRLGGSRPRPPNTAHCQKSGTLELKGQKSKVFAALSLPEMWLYKSEQFFKMGIGICVIEMRGSTIREAKNRSFELITPSKIFSFVAESERDKREWMEALQEAIAEMLYDYEVAEKIWSNKANKYCADCQAQNPDWASINLCVVICKQCAGQHRSLGSNISKVQSLKLDTSVWSNEIVQLFIVLGNDRANRFWAARLPTAEALHPDASAEQRRDFIARKYRDGRYRLPHPHYATQEEVLQALCAAVAAPGLLKTILQFFSSSEWGCPCPWYPHFGGCLLTVLFLTGEPGPEGVYNEITQPVTHSGYLHRATAPPRLPDFQRVWCSLEKSLLFFETEKCTEPLGHIESGELLSLGVSRAQAPTNPGTTERFRFTLELFLTGEKVQQLGADSPETLQAWASTIGKWFTPVSCHCLLGYEFQRAGQLRYKCMLNPERWQQAFFILQKAHLFICPAEEDGAEDSINLRRLQELSLVPPTDTPEKREMLLLVEMGRTFYLQGLSRADTAAWYADIQAAAGGRGNALRDQQLSRGDIPIIVDSCIAFITQGIYRKNGAKSRIKVLMEEFRRDARNVKLRISDNFIEDVTDVLKRFFRELEDPVFTHELHPQWKEAAKISSKPQRLERYKELIHLALLGASAAPAGGIGYCRGPRGVMPGDARGRPSAPPAGGKGTARPEGSSCPVTPEGAPLPHLLVEKGTKRWGEPKWVGCGLGGHFWVHRGGN
uniref:ArfGAP with RhoGAP domain, ankyrin repeat and PH domain 3 n=1 Tax=Anas platyrhynchos TaxID=8839 RepID=A0A8B9T6N8_ANAPL